MASVSSLDQDMRKLRLDRYTPAAANEVRSWIEAMLGERLVPGDLMDSLKDGIALCKLVNRAVSPAVKYKASNMPFVQMENIAHFLAACEAPPINLPAHDRFLTVDLYDAKDPAQVLQCLAAFSRRVNAISPTQFPYALGGRTKSSSMSPQATGSSTGARSPGSTTAATRPRGISAAANDNQPAFAFNSLNRSVYTDSGRKSPVKPSSSLGRGGLATAGSISSWSTKADEGTTAPAWNIHQYGYMGGASQANLGVTFGGRRQITSRTPEMPSLAEKEKQLREEIEQERREADERARREQERRKAEAEQARLEEEQARRQEQRRELLRLKIEREAAAAQEREAAQAKERSRLRTTSDARLNGQFLSQYQADHARAAPSASPLPSSTRSAQAASEAQPTEHDYLRDEWSKAQAAAADGYDVPSRLPGPRPQPSTPSRPLPDPAKASSAYRAGTNRTGRFLASNPAPSITTPTSHSPSEHVHSSTAESDLETARRHQSQQATRAGDWARDLAEGSNPGQTWDVNQYGYLGGDNLNRGGLGLGGLGSGGARRQVVGTDPGKRPLGPRPPP
ncbi:hypothetical protein DV736_g908, partial [Chaetothyriales sp. CBS 134916]